MARLMEKITHDGRLWCSVEDAARYLRTNTNKIRSHMGSGQLACTQIRRNGRIYIAVGDLVKLQTARLDQEKLLKKPVR
jgi:hypothetical protein